MSDKNTILMHESLVASVIASMKNNAANCVGAYTASTSAFPLYGKDAMTMITTLASSSEATNSKHGKINCHDSTSDHAQLKDSKSSKPKSHRSFTHVSSQRRLVAKDLNTTIIQEIVKPAQIVNHSYADFSKVLPIEGEDIQMAFFYDPIANLDEMIFSQKLHHILTTRSNEFGNTIRWLPHGRAFTVLVPAAFEREVLPIYFGHKRFSTFLRHLDNYGFKIITKGPDRNCYYHECMLEGMPHLCKYMPRPRDSRRKRPDPNSEPNLYRISQRFPLPGSKQVASKNVFSNTDESCSSLSSSTSSAATSHKFTSPSMSASRERPAIAAIQDVRYDVANGDNSKRITTASNVSFFASSPTASAYHPNTSTFVNNPACSFAPGSLGWAWFNSEAKAQQAFLMGMQSLLQGHNQSK